MNPATRRLIQVTATDAALTEQVFETFLGDDILARKAFITEHGSEYLDDLDTGDDAV